MNLNTESTGYIVKYLQTFLQTHYSTTVRVTGKYDDDTHHALVKYLSIPDKETMQEVLVQSLDKFPDLDKYFTYQLGPDKVFFTSKNREPNPEVSTAMFAMMTSYSTFLSSVSWKLELFNPYDAPYKITIGALPIESIFPRNELQCMVNQFDNNFRYNLMIRDGGSIRDIIEDPTGLHKIAVINCIGNQDYTITHGDVGNNQVVIGSTQAYDDDIQALPLISGSVITRTVEAGQRIGYTTSPNARNLIIQVPAFSQIVVNPTSQTAESPNVNNLLVIKGSYTQCTDIPFLSYAESPWLVNDSFISYLLNMSITPYSDSSNIYYAQKLIKSIYPDQYDIPNHGIWDSGLQKVIKTFQDSVNPTWTGIIENPDLARNIVVPFALGYLDPVTEGLLITRNPTKVVNSLYD